MSNLYGPGPCQTCGQPGRRYLNAHWCHEHAPANPVPDPARSIEGLRLAAGLPPLSQPTPRRGRHSVARRLDTASPMDTSTGTIEAHGDWAIWTCGLCPVSGQTARHETAERALDAHLRYRHPERAAKVAARAVEAPAAPVGLDHPETSQRAATAALPRSGTIRRRLYDLIAEAGDHGMTDAELETATGGLHQSVSASRNSLMNDGLITDSGHRRRTSTGQDAIAWRLA